MGHEPDGWGGAAWMAVVGLWPSGSGSRFARFHPFASRRWGRCVPALVGAGLAGARVWVVLGWSLRLAFFQLRP